MDTSNTYGSYQPSNFDYAVDTGAMNGGAEGSIFDDVQNFATQGVPLIAKSIYLSFANMPADIGNWFGMDNHIETMQEFLGDNQEQQAYYAAHAQGIDAAGLILGSFVPGLAATKIFSAAKAVNTIKSASSLAAMEDLTFATNILPSVQNAKVLKNAADVIHADVTAYSAITADTIKASAWGMADQALQAAAWETATIATMHSNPVLSDDGLADSISHVFWGGFTGGLFATPFAILGARKSIQDVIAYEQRQHLGQTILEKAGAPAALAGDRVMQTIASVFEMERVAPGVDAAGKTLEKGRSEAVRLDAIQQLNKITGGKEELSNALVDFIYQAKDTGMELIGSGDKLGVLDHLAGLKSITRVNDSKFLTENPNAFFINTHTKTTARDVTHPDGQNYMTSSFDDTAKFSRRFVFTSDEAKKNFAVAKIGDPTSPQMVASADNLAPTAKAAYEAGFDAWIDADGVFHLNPESYKQGGKLKKLPKDVQVDEEVYNYVKTEGRLPDTYKKEVEVFDPATGATTKQVVDAKFENINTASAVLNLKTGTVSKNAYPVIGDLAVHKADKLTGKTMAASEVKLINNGNTLEFGGKAVNYGGVEYKPLEVSNLEANGHFVWAWLKDIKKGETIEGTNLPMLEALAHKLNGKGDEEIAALGLKIDRNGEISELDDLLTIRNSVQDLKRDILRELVDPEQPIRDAADLATRVNAPIEWIKNGGQLDDFANMSINPAEHLKVNNVRVNFDVSPVTFDMDANIAKGIQAVTYRVQIAQERAQAAAASYLQEYLPMVAITDTRMFNSGGVDGTTSGASMLKRADPGDYSNLHGVSLQAGQALTAFMQKEKQAAAEALMAATHGIKSDLAAAAELAVFVNAHRRLTERYTYLNLENPQLRAAAEKVLGRELAQGETVYVPAKALSTDGAGNPIWDTAYVPNASKNAKDAARWISADQLEKMGGSITAAGVTGALGIYTASQKVAEYLHAHFQLNETRLKHMNTFFEASGSARKLETGLLYVPPVSAKNYQHVAFVKQRSGLGGGTDSTTMVLGRSAEDLAQKVSTIKANHPELEVIPYGQTKEYFKARGDYDYNLNMVDNDVNSMLARSGKLVDYVPNVRGETILQEFEDWTNNQITRLARSHAELANGQLFAELDLMGKQWEWLAKSRKGVANERLVAQAAENPYQLIKQQFLGINPRQHYTMWNDAQDKVEAYFSTAFNKAREVFGGVSKGLIPLDQAEALTTKYGLGNPFGTTVSALKNYQLAAGLPNSPMMEKFVRLANTIQSATAIRLDAMQGFINAISTPILMWPEALSAAKKVGVTELPNGSGIGLLTLGKLTAKGMTAAQVNTPENAALIKEALARGLLRKDNREYFELVDSLTLKPGMKDADLIDKIELATDKASKLLLTNWSENAGRIAAVKVGHEIFSAAGHTGEELWANVHTFVNRVHGATIAAQRPVAFQGPIGAAIGLFQTYQFNFLQNVFRYVGQGEYKSLALLAGMQTTLYGMQGLPGFNFINQHIVGNAANNPAHSDIYSGTKSLLGSRLGDIALYGGVSNLIDTGIYTRGDVNPRSLTILPVNPLDIPTVSSGIRFVQNLHNAVAKSVDGDKFWDVFTQALEHNGMSRPVAGLGQLLQGYSTTSQGSLISSNRPASGAGPLDIFTVANFMRLAGARPLDEAVIMDAAFRRTMYQASDTARMSQLGEAVKDSLRKGQSPSDEQMQQFVNKYVAAGGVPQNFGKHIIEWSQQANTSVANDVYRKLATPAILNQQVVMGGKRLPDYSTAPMTGTGSTETAGVQ